MIGRASFADACFSNLKIDDLERIVVSMVD